MATPAIERINVNFPRPVLDDLRRLVPAKRRSEVIARATARELRRLQVAALFEELRRAPAWRAESYPVLVDGPAIDQFIAGMRASGVYASVAASVPESPAPHTPVMAALPSPRRKARRE